MYGGGSRCELGILTECILPRRLLHSHVLSALGAWRHEFIGFAPAVTHGFIVEELHDALAVALFPGRLIPSLRRGAEGLPFAARNSGGVIRWNVELSGRDETGEAGDGSAEWRGNHGCLGWQEGGDEEQQIDIHVEITTLRN